MPATTPSRVPRLWRRTALATVLLAGTALGGFAVGHAGFAATESPTTAGTPVNPPGSNPTNGQVLPDFTNLVHQVKPAVVSINVKLKQDASEAEAGRQQQMPFPFGQMMPFGMHPQARAVEARGSGFIINADGTIVTNNHVVKDAKSVSVTLDDGTKLAAKVVGTDPRTDIAVVKVDARKALPYIQLGNSEKVEPGQWVVAMGNPFGLGGSVTAGIVSAQGRDIGDGPYDHFIQVDAPINQGNSGGPLFTQDGKVIGMNTAILSPSGGSIGIGFAIPSDMIKSVVAQLEKTGHVTRGYIGVSAQQVSETVAKAMRLNGATGALLASVQPDTPASRAGLEPGDVITAVNGQTVKNPRDLAVDVAAVPPGEEAKLDVMRNGQSKTVSVKVAQLPNEQVASTGGNGTESQGQIGLALAPLSPDLRDQLDVPNGTSGAVVRGVQPGSPADAAGLQAGDVIVGVGDKQIDSPSQAASAIRGAVKDHAVALRIIRNGQPLFVGVNMDQSSEG
ncbi:MAG TPA: DegQ family serine endoprotease [Acetobacteraceae bacterium]|jgi:serine protease Do|nr:DegQ family serine endoprotease [Acetobacteraceae bacterium]